MKQFEQEFRLDHPETIGETDTHFDLDNYKDWLEKQLAETRKQLSLFGVNRSNAIDYKKGFELAMSYIEELTSEGDLVEEQMNKWDKLQDFLKGNKE